MRTIVFPVLFLLLPFITPAQSPPLVPRINTIYYKLGIDTVQIKVYQYGDNKDLFFINLHDDEVTAVNSAMKTLEITGGTLVRLENAKQRNMRFRITKKYFAFDPNRIFSRAGIVQTLNTFGLSGPKAIEELHKFAERLAQLFPPAPGFVIALHNNSNGEFSIVSYMTGHEREKDAKAIYAKSIQDPDDMFLTTDSSFFHYLTKERFNVVLQDNDNAYRDGSLSVYCAEKGIHYINCETQHGRIKQYDDMLTLVARFIKTRIPDIISYTYRLSPNPDSITLYKPCDIWFGEKKIGQANPESAITRRNFSGQIQAAKTFPLYDNMDLFYYPAVGNNAAKIDLRIDPTRPKKLYDPAKAVIPIKVMH